MVDISRMLITGGESSIARELPFGIKLSHKELDVTDEKSIERAFVKYSPSAVLCLASMDLALCEKDPLTAYNVNVLGVYNIARQATKQKIPIVMISSGAIFNGEVSKKFSEQSIPNPINIYGQTKYFAEIMLREMTQDYLIIRTGWIFGLKNKPNGFSKFVDKLISTRDEKTIIKATNDQFGSPTYIVDFAEKLQEFIRSNTRGIVHIVNEGSASASDIAQEIKLQTKNNFSLEKVITQIIPGNASRSKSEALLSDKLRMRSWQEAIGEYIKSNSN